MPIVTGLSFRSIGKVTYFDPNGINLHYGDKVLANTARGLELGIVKVAPREAAEAEAPPSLPRVLRKASREDLRREEDNRRREAEAFSVGVEKIAAYGLPMKLAAVEYTFDGGRIVFHFSAEGRVDFRTLVRDLARYFHTRIELHQIGVRDEAKLHSGRGPCGRPLCCASFLSEFDPVGIKMAKEQYLSLNPLKISGVCGRLMCCLNYEYEMYREAKKGLPKVGAEVDTPAGRAKVIEISVPRDTVRVLLAEGGVAEFAAADLLGASPCCAQTSSCDKSCAAADSEPAGVAQPPPAVSTTPAEGAVASETAEGGDGPAASRAKRRRHRRKRRPGASGPPADVPKPA